MDSMIPIPGYGQYDAARRGLEKLRAEFEYAAALPLGHQLISPLDKPWPDHKWAAFIAANNKTSGERQEFEVFPGKDCCSRFYGMGSLRSFISMAEIGMAVLNRISKMREDRTIILQGGLTLRLPSCEGYQGWLQLLYETARCYSTHVLHAEPGYWGCSGQFPSDEANPDHPFYEELRCDLFKSSADAINLWLDPSEAMCIGEHITDTPIYLPPEPEKDGPYPPNMFWLWGQKYEFSPKAWLLLEYLWMNLPFPVKMEDANKYVYGGADDCEDEAAFQSTVKRLQSELGKRNCPAEVHCKKLYITLEIFPRVLPTQALIEPPVIPAKV